MFVLNILVFFWFLGIWFCICLSGGLCYVLGRRRKCFGIRWFVGRWCCGLLCLVFMWFCFLKGMGDNGGIYKGRCGWCKIWLECGFFGWRKCFFCWLFCCNWYEMGLRLMMLRCLMLLLVMCLVVISVIYFCFEIKWFICF